MKLKLKGIERRSDTNTLTIEQAAAIICNARLQGDTFKFVGQKVLLDSAEDITQSYSNFYWHSKIGEKYIIAINTTAKLITIKSLNDGATTQRNFLKNFDWQGDSTGFSYSGDFIGMSHLNDIIVLDTTEGKYYFFWDENADREGRGNFVWLDELPVPVLDVEKNTTVESIHIGKVKNSFTFNYSNAERTFEDSAFNKGVNEFKAHLNSVFLKALKNNVVSGSFYVRAAYKMFDGTYIYPSNPIFICNYTDKYSEENNFYVGKLHINVFTQMVNEETINICEYYTFLERLADDYISGTSGGVPIRDLYDSAMGTTGTSFTTYIQETTHGYKYKWKIKIPVNTLRILQKWFDKGLITSIDLFITKPDMFWDLDKISKVGIGQVDAVVYGINYPTKRRWQKAAIPFNKEITETDFTKKIFYKVDSIKDFTDGINVEYDQNYWAIKNKESYIQFKNAIDIETNEAFPVNNTYIVPKSANYKLYNSMIHLLGVKNYFKNPPYSFQAITNYNGYTDCELHFLISEGTKEFWIKVPVNKFYAYAASATTHKFTISDNILYFPDYRARKVNITFLKSGTRRIYKSINLLSFVNHNIAVEDNKSPFIIGSGEEIYGMTPTYLNNYSRFIIDTTATYPEVDYETIDSYEDLNRMQLSATDNPFIFPPDRSYRYGDKDNKIIGAETAAVELQDYNFGRFPLYVFTKNGIFIMEVGSSDIAYSTQHLYRQMLCLDNKNVIKNCRGVISFLAEDGVNIILNGKIINVTKQIEGNNNLKYSEATLYLLDDINRLVEVNTPFRNATDYFFRNSHVAYDNLYNEIIFINENFSIQFVLNLNNLTFSIRTDKVGLKREYSQVIQANNRSILCAKENNFWTFYSTNEYDKIPNVEGRGNVLFVSTIIPLHQYLRIEHMITRFELSPIILDDGQILRYSIKLFLLGSRDGIEWKPIAGGEKNLIGKSINSLEIRRAFTSVRYIQAVFYATYNDMNETIVKQILQGIYTIDNNVLLTNSFSEFDIEHKKEHNTKLR